MKKILILLFLFVPIFMNAQDWFKANAVRFAVENEYSEWKECDIKVFMGEDRKIKIYSSETHTIRAVGEANLDVNEKNGTECIFWQGVDEEGKDCIVCIKSDQATYIHLMITFIKDNFIINYNLIPDK